MLIVEIEKKNAPIQGGQGQQDGGWIECGSERKRGIKGMFCLEGPGGLGCSLLTRGRR